MTERRFDDGYRNDPLFGEFTNGYTTSSGITDIIDTKKWEEHQPANEQTDLEVG